MIAGLTLEPLKHALLLSIGAKVARTQIHKELARNYCLALWLGRDNNEGFLRHTIPQLSTEVFDYYYNQKREVFYAIDAHIDLEGFYRKVKATREAVTTGNISGMEAKNRLEADYQMRFRAKTLPESKILKYVEEFKAQAMVYAPMVIPKKSS